MTPITACSLGDIGYWFNANDENIYAKHAAASANTRWINWFWMINPGPSGGAYYRVELAKRHIEIAYNAITNG